MKTFTKDLRGKTIEAWDMTQDHLFLSFTDNTYTVFSAGLGYEGEGELFQEKYYDIAPNFWKELALELKLCTPEEYDKLKNILTQKRAEQQQKKDKAEYERLKAIYDKQ